MFRPRDRKGTGGQGAPRQPSGADGIFVRRCHDCGRATSDYRCPACLRKWRLKNGVLLDAKDEEGL